MASVPVLAFRRRIIRARGSAPVHDQVEPY